jgi:hypothetical protein
MAGVRKRDFEHNELAQREAVGNESINPTCAEITCPPLHNRTLMCGMIPILAKVNPDL